MSDLLLPFRFRVNWETVLQQEFAYFEFPWLKAFADFLAEMNPRSEYYTPPYTLLNHALRLFAPPLISGFRFADKSEDGIERQVMLSQIGPEYDEFKPEQIAEITHAFAGVWAESKFKEKMKNSRNRDHLARLQDAILASNNHQWQPCILANVIKRDNRFNESLFFSMASSVLASYLAFQPHSTVQIGDITQPIAWQRAQDDNGRLCVVSQPIKAIFEDEDEEGNRLYKEGYFAYVIRLIAQTQAGNFDPWIHLAISCRRYLSKSLEDKNWGRDITTYIRLHSPLLENWPALPPTLVPQKIASSDGESYYWAGYLPRIIQRVEGRTLKEAGNVLGDPDRYFNLTGADEYFVVYAEGLRPGHDVQTGFSPLELKTLRDEIARIFEGILVPADPLTRDPATWRQSRPVAYFAHKQLESEKKDKAAALVRQGIRQATDGSVTIGIFWHTEPTRDEVIRQLKTLFGVDDLAQLRAEGIEIIIKQTEDRTLLEPLDSGGITPDMLKRLNEKERSQKTEERKKRIETAWKFRKKQWQVFFQENLPKKKYAVAFIERRPLGKGVLLLQDYHEAIREAGVEYGIGTQMLRPVSPDFDPNGKNYKNTKTYNRVRNALRDMLLRQLGVIFGDVKQIYQLPYVQIGKKKEHLPETLTKDLNVIGLYLHRSNKPYLRYPMAVKIPSSGPILGKLPKGEWQPYLFATIALGKTLRDMRNDPTLPRTLEQDEMVGFVYDIVADSKDEPTLILLVADDWRGGYSGWSQMQNAQMRLNQLDFTIYKKHLPIFTPKDFPHLRMVLIREQRDWETPQYVIESDGKLKYSSGSLGAGYLDEQADSQDFLHYFSIGRLGIVEGMIKQYPDVISQAKRSLGAKYAFKRQSILGIVPFFYQNKDNRLLLAQLAHFLRFNAAWGGGHTISPLPIHLARNSFNNLEGLLNL